jgi:hypothetical protein
MKVEEQKGKIERSKRIEKGSFFFSQRLHFLPAVSGNNMLTTANCAKISLICPRSDDV